MAPDLDPARAGIQKQNPAGTATHFQPSQEDAPREIGGSIPQLHSLVAFEAIARHRSISAAARELGVTRSALSHSISLLEYRLQVRLFRRTHPTIELTRVGARYLNAVQLFASTLGDSLHRLSPDARTTLRLAVSPDIARLWLGARLPSFHANHPRIDLNVTLLYDFSDDVLEQADVVLRYASGSMNEVLAIPLWREAVIAVATPPMAREAMEIAPQNFLHRFPLIQISQFSWDAWLEGASGRRAAQHATLITPDVVYGLEMAVNGMGIVLAPRRLAQRYLQHRRLALASSLEQSGNYYYALTLEANAGRLPVAAFLAWLAGEVHDTRG